MRNLTKNEREKIVNVAMGWLGVSYRLFGNNKEGIDCSHFVLQVYKTALGINLIRNTSKIYLASWLFKELDVIPRGGNVLSAASFFITQKGTACAVPFCFFLSLNA